MELFYALCKEGSVILSTLQIGKQKDQFISIHVGGKGQGFDWNNYNNNKKGFSS